MNSHLGTAGNLVGTDKTVRHFAVLGIGEVFMPLYKWSFKVSHEALARVTPAGTCFFGSTGKAGLSKSKPFHAWHHPQILVNDKG